MLLTFMAEEPLVLDPDDQLAESRNNTWSLGADVEERLALTVEQVAAAFEQTAEALRERVRALASCSAATFYVWHDAQAGQLRCSTTSLPPQALPFSGAYVTTETIEPIIASFLSDSSPGLVEWSGLGAVGIDGQNHPDAVSEPRPFPVWARRIGRDA
jgi:hypothetical protein